MEAQNQALMSKIAELEALAEKKQEKAPVATEASRVEALLEQMVTRVSGLETKLQNSEPNKIPDKALPPSSATNGNKANEDDDDDESDSEDDGFITTPSGQQVPPTSFSIYIPFLYISYIYIWFLKDPWIQQSTCTKTWGIVGRGIYFIPRSCTTENIWNDPIYTLYI